MEQTKKCSKCGVEKVFSDFYKHKGRKHGLATECKVCSAKVGAESRRKRTEDISKHAGKCTELITEYRRENAEKRARTLADIRAESEREKAEAIAARELEFKRKEAERVADLIRIRELQAAKEVISGQTKKCSKCGAEKPFSEFNKQKLGKFGLEGSCRCCKKEASKRNSSNPEKKAAKKAYQNDPLNKARDRERRKIRGAIPEVRARRREMRLIRDSSPEAKRKQAERDKRPEYVARRERHRKTIGKDKQKEYRARWLAKPESKLVHAAWSEQYSQRHEVASAAAAKAAMRREHVRKQTIAETYADEIKEIYRLAKETAELSGLEIHVDHIIPLQGITEDGNEVFGLHVPWNLVPVYAKTNLKKHNKARQADALAW